MRETKLSPEQLAKRLGFSNMTIRRWKKKPPSEKVAPIYEKALRDAVYQMALDGILAVDSRSYQSVSKTTRPLSFTVILKSLGFRNDFKKGPSFSPGRLMVGLSQVGDKESRKAEVDHNRKKILSFSRMGAEWKERITTLLRVTRSRKLTSMDKLVAYGALFYLLCPLDLIPDNMPVFGLMDDFCVLGLATTYYIQKFGKMV
jgi:uncharacterized membrane protein YkvA (DUF1232 family)